MAEFSTKYLSYRGTLNAPAAQHMSELNANLDYAQRMLATAKDENDTRLVRLAKGRIREAQAELMAIGGQAA